MLINTVSADERMRKSLTVQHPHKTTMNIDKIGNIIHELRIEKGMTQKELADCLNVSDKTVSKWECAGGYPDISLLPALSNALNVDLSKLFQGDVVQKNSDGGSMKRIKFYICPVCSNIITATGNADVSCCGRKLEALQAQSPDEAHTPLLHQVEDELYVTFEHEMQKSHYISFAALVTYDRATIIKMYPEQNAACRIPKIRGSRLFYGCTVHGLYETMIKQ